MGMFHQAYASVRQQILLTLEEERDTPSRPSDVAERLPPGATKAWVNVVEIAKSSSMCTHVMFDSALFGLRPVPTFDSLRRNSREASSPRFSAGGEQRGAAGRQGGWFCSETLCAGISRGHPRMGYAYVKK